MAKQTGPVPIEGVIGDLIYYKTIYGNLVRRKGSLNKDRVMSDPAFKGSRAAGSEFGRSGIASGLLRNAIKKFCPYAGNGQTHFRLSKLFGTIIRLDTEHPQGERQVLAEHCGALKSFEWIQDHPLNRSFWAQCGGSMSPEGKLTLSMSGLNPKRDLGWPLNATHAELTLICFAADFPNKTIEVDGAKSGKLPKVNSSADLVLECQIPIQQTDVVMAGIGVQFFEGEHALAEGAAFGLVG